MTTQDFPIKTTPYPQCMGGITANLDVKPPPTAPLWLGTIQVNSNSSLTAGQVTGTVHPGHDAQHLGSVTVSLSPGDFATFCTFLTNSAANQLPIEVTLSWNPQNRVTAFTYYNPSALIAILTQISQQLDQDVVGQLRKLNHQVDKLTALVHHQEQPHAVLGDLGAGPPATKVDQNGTDVAAPE